MKFVMYIKGLELSVQKNGMSLRNGIEIVRILFYVPYLLNMLARRCVWDRDVFLFMRMFQKQ